MSPPPEPGPFDAAKPSPSSTPEDRLQAPKAGRHPSMDRAAVPPARAVACGGRQLRGGRVVTLRIGSRLFGGLAAFVEASCEKRVRLNITPATVKEGAMAAAEKLKPAMG